MKKRNEEISFKEILNIFAPKLWIIVVCAVVLAAVLGGYALLFKSDTYTSKATMMLSRDNSTTISSSDIELSYRVIENLQIVIYSRDFLESVADDLNAAYPERGWNINADMLEKSVVLSTTGETSVFTLSVTTTDSYKSFAIAEVLMSQLLSDSTTGAEAPIKTFLPNAYSKINIKAIESPRQAIEKNSKGVVTNALVGALGGAVLSMVIIYLVHAFDVIVHDRKKLEETFDIPVIGVIPRYDVGDFDDEEDTDAKGEGAI